MRKARNSAKNDKIKPKRHKNNANRTTMHTHRGFLLPIFQEKYMLETYLTVKTVFLLLNLALLLLYLILCGIALIQAVVERREFQKAIKQLVDDEKKRHAD